MEKKNNGIGKFIAGAAVGVGLGMLFAPKSGAETRKELQEIDVKEVRDSFLDKIDEIKKELADLDKEKVAAIAKEKATSIKKKMDDLVEEAKEKATPVIQKTVEELRTKTIQVLKDTVNKLENPKEDKKEKKSTNKK